MNISQSLAEKLQEKIKQSTEQNKFFGSCIETGILYGFISTLPDNDENRKHFESFLNREIA